MKKLLDELQSLKNEYNPQKYTTDADIVFGIEKAIIAVRAYNPWHEVTELPPKVEGKCYSIEVNVTDGNEVRLGMYDYELNRWFIRGYRPSVVYFNPTHWAYLPESPK